MRRLVAAVSSVVALVLASTALAAYQYAPARQWNPGDGAGSTVQLQLARQLLHDVRLGLRTRP